MAKNFGRFGAYMLFSSLALAGTSYMVKPNRYESARDSYLATTLRETLAYASDASCLTGLLLIFAEERRRQNKRGSGVNSSGK